MQEPGTTLDSRPSRLEKRRVPFPTLTTSISNIGKLIYAKVDSLVTLLPGSWRRLCGELACVESSMLLPAIAERDSK